MQREHNKNVVARGGNVSFARVTEIRAELAVEMVATSRLFLSPSNPRINDAAVDPVAASIRKFGFQQPLVARRTGEVIAGNTRLRAAQKLGIERVPVVWFDGSDLDAVAYAIADNKTSQYAEWDEPALAKLLAQLKEEDCLDAASFSEDELDEIIASCKANEPRPTIDDPGPGAPPVNPVTKRGDLWVLGEHKILCGDSTNVTDVDRLLGNDRPVLFSTDPPYCVEYTGNNRPIHDGKKSGKDWSGLYNEVDIKDLEQFLDGVFKAYLPRVVESAPLYVWYAHLRQSKIAAVFEKHNILFHQVIVWSKPTPVFTHCFFQWQHEVCAFGWRRGHKPKHGVAQYSTVWQVDWEGKSRIVGNQHPTQKPLRLFSLPMELHSKPGDIIVEPFSGSGSQLIAAETMGRRCRAMELQPAFVDVAIERWQTATQQMAVLDGDGRTYATIRAERIGNG